MNNEQILLLVLGAVLNGVMILIGMWMGTRQSAKAMVKELERSELVKLVKKTFTDQTLIAKATKFFEEATILVSSPEAKNFFKTLTEFFSSGTQTSEALQLPSPEDFKRKRGNEDV